VQLAAADEHRSDLGQLTALAAVAVRLDVDGGELGRRELCAHAVHEGGMDTPSLGRAATRLAADLTDRARGERGARCRG